MLDQGPIACIHLNVSGAIIVNVILYAFYELNGSRLMFRIILFVKRIQNDVQDDVMCDAK